MSNQFWALNPAHKHELFYAPKCDNATSTPNQQQDSNLRFRI
jgi:hypothetical protein